MAREYKKITYEDYKAACRDYKNITDEDFKAAWNLIDYLGLLKQRSLVSYTSRDYNSLVKEFWNCVSYLTDLWSPEDHYWKPEANADPGVILGKYIASVADMLGVNLDWAVNEMFAPSVSQRKNAEKLFDLIGYNLGYYTAAKTEVTFTNIQETPITVDFGFNGSNFCTLNTYTDIADNPRVITYNILPRTNAYGRTESRSTRQTVTNNIHVFDSSDKVTLNPGDSVTRVAIEGDLRYYSVSVEQVKQNNYIITLPSQHVDTTAIWMMAKASQTAENYVETRWLQVETPAEFIEPEPRFCVTFDSYSNAQIQVSNYLNQLENYDGNWLIIYWIDCSGIIGCVGENVLTNLLWSKPDENLPSSESGALGITNLSNTTELPHTYTVTGKSPETAKEAYLNSRNYINTWDSLVTLPDYTRFLKREAGVDTGIVLDCQKTLEINLAIYNDKNLTDAQKQKMYITNQDFPAGAPIFDWASVLDLDFDPTDPNKFVFAANFQTYTAMCFAIHNDFLPSKYGEGQTSKVQIKKNTKFIRYKPPVVFIDNVIKDYRPLQAMSVEIQFGYLRIFNFYVVGTITPIRHVSQENADLLVAKAKEALALYFAPANFDIGRKPTIMDVVETIENCDPGIRHFDPGAPKSYGIEYYSCDIEYFNPISFARYAPLQNSTIDIRVNPAYIVE